MFLAEKIDSKSVEIELGCMFVVESVQLMDDYLDLDVAVITECKQFATNLTKINFKNYSHKANQVAGSLANLYSSRSSSSWEDSILDLISHRIVNDIWPLYEKYSLLPIKEMYDSHKLPFFKSTKHETILLLLVSKKNTIQSQFEATIKKQNI